MISLLIVEDNNFERESLKECINWELVGIGNIFTASDGHEGLEMIKKHHPDIVLTDIKMPRMDGLEMLEQVNKMDIKPKFVFFSAFEDFSYVKQAMRRGAVNYLLKPVNQRELIQTIREVANTIIDEKLNEDERKRYREEYNRYVNMIKINFLKDLILSEQRKKAQDIYLNMSGVYLKMHAAYRIASVEIFYHYSEKKDIHTCNNRITHALSIGSIRSNAECFFNDAGILIILFHSIKNETDFENIMPLILDTLTTLKEKMNFDYFVGVSSLSTDITHLNNLYKQSISMLEKRIILGYGHVEYYTGAESNKTTTSDGQGKIDNIIRNVVNRIFTGQEIDSTFEELENTLKMYYSNNMEGIQSVLVKLVSDLISNSLTHGKDKDESEYEIYQNVIKARSLPGALAYVKQLCENIQGKLIANSKNKVDKLIDELIAIINTEYKENITLSYLSKKVFLSANYIRLVFKEKTGVSILDYLLKVRIEKAKKLLAETDLNIGDISSMVGYPNSSYFCTVFKSKTGISPSEYRRMKKTEGG